ncbi:MAG: nickel-dependent hydrogenase large subunit [Syntrophomonadaceae bacterium]|nr:nickel-dependent hydrogenase large subunit [Syntrophomonadaceae bacterium]
MAQKIIIDPVTRIEGHLKIEAEVDGGKVIEARSSGSLFRGIELILQGRDPRDAQHFVMRICGVCPISHATASAMALDSAFGLEVPDNGRIIRNLIYGANFIHSHLLHFYALAALDYVDVVRAGLAVPPFMPRYEVAGEYRLPDALNKAAAEQYVQALDMRKKAHEMLAIWGGRAPHPQAIVPGGVTEIVDAQKVIEYAYRLKELRSFVENVYVPTVQKVAELYSDYLEVGVGCKNMLAYGGFPQSAADPQGADGFFKRGAYIQGKDVVMSPNLITEEVKYSWYNDDTGGSKHPDESVITPNPQKPGAYSWLKAPRYDGHPMEVGPLARMWVGKNQAVRSLGDKAFSVMGRHFARAVECLELTKIMEQWLLQLQPGKPVCVPHIIPKEADGIGLTEGPRGALGHWIKIEKGLTSKYNAVVPTTWNAAPKDDKGQRGPIEEALVGTTVKDPKNPIELVRIVRAFDPCLGCAIHLMTPDKKVLSEYRIN